jgi:hypothetical protein
MHEEDAGKHQVFAEVSHARNPARVMPSISIRKLRCDTGLFSPPAMLDLLSIQRLKGLLMR